MIAYGVLYISRCLHCGATVTAHHAPRHFADYGWDSLWDSAKEWRLAWPSAALGRHIWDDTTVGRLVEVARQRGPRYRLNDDGTATLIEDKKP